MRCSGRWNKTALLRRRASSATAGPPKTCQIRRWPDHAIQTPICDEPLGEQPASSEPMVPDSLWSRETNWYEAKRHTLRHDPKGVGRVIDASGIAPKGARQCGNSKDIGLLPQQPQSHELLPCRQGWLPDRVWRGGGCKQGADDPAPQTLRQKLGSGGCVSCVAHLSSSQVFAKVEAISASRSNAELPVYHLQWMSIGIQRSPAFIAQFGPTAGGKER